MLEGRITVSRQIKIFADPLCFKALAVFFPERSNGNPYETGILPVVGKIKDVKRIPIQATLLSALFMIFYFFVAGIVTGEILNIQCKSLQIRST